MSWTAYYDDGKEYSDCGTQPDDLPVDGVQLIVETHQDGTRTLHHGCDYYVWMEDCWASGMQKDLDRWLRVRPRRPLIVLFGRWTSAEMYKDILRRAQEKECADCGD